MFKANLTKYKNTLPLTDNETERALSPRNNNFHIEQAGYYKLIDNGTYYYPAWKHYNRKTSIFCDRCHRQNLRACIGYANFDLCLLCVDELTRLNFDCPSRHCHESKFINDNSVSFSRPDYIDLNKYYFNQHYDLNTNTNNNNNKMEHFENFTEKQSYNINFMVVFIIIIIFMFIFYNCNN